MRLCDRVHVLSLARFPLAFPVASYDPIIYVFPFDYMYLIDVAFSAYCVA